MTIAGAEPIDTRIGKLTFASGYSSKDPVQKLYDEMDFQRACQAYIWGIPAVGLAKWRLAHRDVLKAKNGEMLSYLDFKDLASSRQTTRRRTLPRSSICKRADPSSSSSRAA
jgi:hypothetical protein